MRNKPDINKNYARINREIKIIQDCSSIYLVKLGSIKPFFRNIGADCYCIYSEEFLPGESLRKKINAKYKPELRELCELFICGLSAIREFASKKIIHRDIKPENIIATGLSDRPYVLLDFGIAFQQGQTPLTQNTFNIPGTLCYVAPEMLENGFRQNLDYRADLYTLGLTLYEYAAGINPFRKTQESPFDTLYRIKTVSPEKLQKLRNDLPTDFCNIIDQLIRKIPALRPANIDMLIGKVEGFK